MNDEMIIRFAITLKISADALLGLKEVDLPNVKHSVRFTKRLRNLEALPEQRKRAIIRMLDELIKTDQSLPIQEVPDDVSYHSRNR